MKRIQVERREERERERVREGEGWNRGCARTREGESDRD